MSYTCKVLADSLSPDGARLTTLEATFPRIVLAEFNTHRVLSRNSASSRAIPVQKMLERVASDPFIPAAWPKNQKGMQAAENLSDMAADDAKQAWLEARDMAVERALMMLSLGVHKQIANRLLEPFLWHTVIVTATEWANFFALRCHPNAQPEIQTIAYMMRDAMAASSPAEKERGEWHLPLVPDLAELQEEYHLADIARISCARCARVSYLTHDGRRDPEEDVKLGLRLQQAGHMSPFEHAAQAIDPTYPGDFGNFRAPWLQYRKQLIGEAVFRG